MFNYLQTLFVLAVRLPDHLESHPIPSLKYAPHIFRVHKLRHAFHPPALAPKYEYALVLIEMGSPLDVMETEDAVVMHVMGNGQLATGSQGQTLRNAKSRPSSADCSKYWRLFFAGTPSMAGRKRQRKLSVISAATPSRSPAVIASTKLVAMYGVDLVIGAFTCLSRTKFLLISFVDDHFDIWC
ncbi:hypothetical protein B0H19DRAFT_1074870 [Mycena capillaripes]|nr:hypothetical protein B0H19DRAFT_1074870 [Mycena capillaripes]